MRKKSAAGAKSWVDPDDAPELKAAHFENADLYDGPTLVRRGRPRVKSPRKMLSMRLEQDVIEALRSSGRGWQRRANDILKSALKASESES
jgi:uncharacterized protein (DUF4415 family)